MATDPIIKPTNETPARRGNASTPTTGATTEGGAPIAANAIDSCKRTATKNGRQAACKDGRVKSCNLCQSRRLSPHSGHW
jgi:hypothetical protein